MRILQALAVNRSQLHLGRMLLRLAQSLFPCFDVVFQLSADMVYPELALGLKLSDELSVNGLVALVLYGLRAYLHRHHLELLPALAHGVTRGHLLRQPLPGRHIQFKMLRSIHIVLHHFLNQLVLLIEVAYCALLSIPLVEKLILR